MVVKGVLIRVLSTVIQMMDQIEPAHGESQQFWACAAVSKVCSPAFII